MAPTLTHYEMIRIRLGVLVKEGVETVTSICVTGITPIMVDKGEDIMTFHTDPIGQASQELNRIVDYWRVNNMAEKESPRD